LAMTEASAEASVVCPEGKDELPLLNGLKR
jgi:hypothetical protein